MKKYFIFMAAVFVSISAPAQPPDTLWSRTYLDGNWAYAFSVEQTTDEGFIICGNTIPFGSTYPDIYLVKTDSIGDTIWTRRYGDNLPQTGHEVHQTGDGGYIIVGLNVPQVYWNDAYLIKTDRNGDVIWEQTYRFDYDSKGVSVCQTSDGGYALTGDYSDDNDVSFMIVVKTDSMGHEDWRYVLEDYAYSFGWGIVQSDDGNIVLTGRAKTSSQQYTDLFLMKMDLNGDTLWTKTYGGDLTDIGYCITNTTDGGYVIGGSSRSNTSDADFYLVKTDSVGDTLWTNTFGFSDDEYAYGVDQTSDGGYVLAGITLTDAVDNQDCYLIRTDASGDELWSSIIRGDGRDHFESVQQTNDGGFIVAGDTEHYDPARQFYLVKYDSESNIVKEFAKTQIHDFRLYPPYPNPFNVSTAISFELRDAGFVSLEIFDITGREVGSLVSGHQSAGFHQVVFDAKDLTSGVYFARLEAGEFRKTRKMLLVK